MLLNGLRFAERMARHFGAIPGVPVGATYPDRRAVAAANVHLPLIAGISGSGKEGADSIVVSGGYPDDEDYGNVIVYTGHGGQDPSTKQHVVDQTLTVGNLALALSADRGLPVRVVRGSEGDPAHSPPSGYRYDGLYYVESYGQEVGRDGFIVWRYRLVQEPATNPVTNPPPQPPPGAGPITTYSSVQRLVRNTAVTEWVKELHDFTCQVCGLRLVTAAGPYSEGAHLRPVGSPHHGPDDVSNVLCLCPNDHILLDRGALVIDDHWNVVDRASGTIVGPLRRKSHHTLDAAHAAYQRALFP
jgi:putative restriction endonuclease